MSEFEGRPDLTQTWQFGRKLTQSKFILAGSADSTIVGSRNWGAISPVPVANLIRLAVDSESGDAVG
jgi:hypothetical protein